MRRPLIVGLMAAILAASVSIGVGRTTGAVDHATVTECPSTPYGFTGAGPPDGARPPVWAAGLPAGRDTGAVAHDVTITSADGTPLRARVFRPTAFSGRLPTVLHVSYQWTFPVDRVALDDLGLLPLTGECGVPFFLRRGYAVVAADMRGSGGSGGCIDLGGPADAADGNAWLDWITGQPWSDGAVGTRGYSLDGLVQYGIAASGHPALKAIIPTSATDLWHAAHMGGTLREYGLLLPAVLTPIPAQPAVRPSAPLPVDLESTACALGYAEAMARPDGRLTTPFVERDPVHLIPRIKAAVLHASGGTDPVLLDNIGGFGRAWSALEASNRVRAGMIGPWAHGYPPGVWWPLVELRWFEQFVRGRATGALDESPLTLYDQEGVARTVDQLDGAPWKLAVARDSLATDLSPTTSATMLDIPGAHRFLVRNTMALRLDYRTRPLHPAITIGGRPTLDALVAVDGTDTNVVAMLSDIAPDGARHLITVGYLNARHRNGDTAAPVDIVPGQRTRLRVVMEPASWTIASSHRLELIIATEDGCALAAEDPPELGPDFCRNGLVPTIGPLQTTFFEGSRRLMLSLPIAEGTPPALLRPDLPVR